MYNSHILKISIIVHLLATSVIAQEISVEKAKEVLAMNVMGKESLIGQTAPELNIEKYLQAPEGEKSLSALKGKVVVLEFWATWCAPCVAEIPHLNQLNEEFRDKQVQFISVTDEGEDIIAPFLKRQEMKSWIGLDTDRSVFEAYGVRGIPRTFLIDQKGIIAASLHPVGLSSDMIKKVIAGEKIELPKLPKPKTVENEGTDPIFKILIAPTEKEGGRQFKQNFKRIQTTGSREQNIAPDFKHGLWCSHNADSGARGTFRVAVRDFSQTADQSVRITIPTSVDCITTVARFQPEKIC